MPRDLVGAIAVPLTIDSGYRPNFVPIRPSKNRASPLHQREHMRGHRARQGVEVVAALQHRHDAAAAAPLSDFHQAPRHPDIVRFDEIEVAKRIAAVGVESRRDDNEIRREVGDPRQDHDFHRLAEGFAPVAGAQGGIDDLIVLPALPYLPRAGKMPHFVRRGAHDGLIVPEDVLRAVAMMDVEIDDRDALGAAKITPLTVAAFSSRLSRYSWPTYDRKLEEIFAAEEVVDAHLLGFVQKLERRSRR